MEERQVKDQRQQTLNLAKILMTATVTRRLYVETDSFQRRR